MKISPQVAIFLPFLFTIVLGFSLSYPIRSFSNSANYSLQYFNAFVLDFPYFWASGILVLGVFFYIFYTIGGSRIVEEQSQNFLADRPFITIDFIAPDSYIAKNIGATPAINAAYGFFKNSSWGEISTSRTIMPGEEFMFSASEAHEFTGVQYTDLDNNIYCSVSYGLESDIIYKNTYFFDSNLQKLSKRILLKRVSISSYKVKKKRFFASKTFLRKHVKSV